MRNISLENNSLTVIDTDVNGDVTRWTLQVDQIENHLPMFGTDIAQKMTRADRVAIAAIIEKDTPEIPMNAAEILTLEQIKK